MRVVWSTLLSLALTVAPVRAATAQSVDLLAGGLGGLGNADGIGADARFTKPSGVVIDGTGNLYVADRDNHTIRRVVLATGSVSTIAGSPGMPGSADGIGAAARFFYPSGVATDGAGNLYVSDAANETIRKVDLATAQVTTFAGSPGIAGSADGIGPAARFNTPYGLATDSVGNLYVADLGNSTVRKIVLSTAGVTTLAGSPGMPGSADGLGSAARFRNPFGVKADAEGSLYVADTNNHTIRKIALATSEVTTLAGLAGVPGSTDGIGTAARFNRPVDVVAGEGGNVYVADETNQTIRKVVLATRMVTTLAGAPGMSGSADGLGGAAQFNLPRGVVADAANLYIGDFENHTIRKIALDTTDVTTPAGLAARPGSTDGVGAAARFNTPSRVAVDDAGNVYVADSYNHTIRKIILDTGEVSTLVGSPGAPGSTDGVGAAARFYVPTAVTIDGVGNLYVGDTGNHTIRKIELATAGVTTVAGTPGMFGSDDGIGAAARFNVPVGVAVDGAGTLYVGDYNNHTIRQINLATGEVTTLAGVAGASGSADGIGDSARFFNPSAVAADGADTLYVADQSNHTIRKILLTTAQVSTLAGAPGIAGSADGVGTAARFNFPAGVSVDGAGKLYVADTTNSTLRQIDPASSVVTTVVGVAGVRGVQLGPLPARLNFVGGPAVAATGEVIITSENSILLLH